jgi:hypothetical protein
MSLRQNASLAHSLPPTHLGHILHTFTGASFMTTTGKFSGDLAALKATVARTGLQGQWSGRNPYMFTAISGAMLRWWSSTGTIVFQGPEVARDALEDAFTAALAAQATLPVSEEEQVISIPRKAPRRGKRRGGGK